MRVVEIARPGGPDVLRLVERDVPQPGDGEVVVRVAAAGVNRPDVQQRRGLYPPPPGTTDIPGLDIAGIVHATGPGVQDLAVGAAVCALANGGGYADFCVVPAVQCMPVPRGLDFVQAASLPEVFFTAWNNIVWLGRLGRGETLLVHGGTSGVGMAAIQIARLLFGARVLATAGSEEKRRVCRDAGAEAAFDYKGGWDVEIRYRLSGSGVDMILDGQAGPATQRQLDLLNPDGRLVLIASHQGEFAEIRRRTVGQHVAARDLIASVDQRALIDTSVLVGTRVLGQIVDVDTRLAGGSLVVIDAHHDTGRVDRIDQTAALRHYGDTGVDGNRSLHARADERCFRAQRRHRLALHVRAHQRAVRVIVLEKRNQ